MKKFIIRATIESAIFALCTTGLTALGYFLWGESWGNNELLLTLALTFVGWYIWTIIDTYVLKNKE